MKNAKSKVELEKKYVIKFIVSSLFGLGAFMFPISSLNNQTLVATFSEWLVKSFNQELFYFIVAIIWITSICSLIATFHKRTGRVSKSSFVAKLDKYFYTKPIYLVTNIASSIILVLIVFGVDVPIVTSDQTGGNMIELSKSLVTISIALSYVLPFLTNCGIMEFFSVLAQNMITPLFKIPGVAALDFVTSWFGASNAEVILTREKYKMGFYNKRETANIMCNFSLVSVSFVYVVSQIAKLEEHFTQIFLIACFISVVLAIIMPRIYPLNALSNGYYSRQRVIDNRPPIGVGKIEWGLKLGSEKAKKFGMKEILVDGTEIMISIWINLVPIVISWGTLGLILVYYTPVFTYISYPIGKILELLNIESAMLVAPATLIGFVDMFIPSLLITDIPSAETRFIITLLSLVQMIYMTEVGAVILQSDLGIDFKKLVLVFLERTILSFPLIYIFAKLIF